MYRFRLQTLLRLRIAARDQRRAELAKALRAEQLLYEEQERLQEERSDVAQNGRQLKSPGQANVDSLLNHHRYEVLLGLKTRQLAAQTAEVQAETERRRQALVEADRDVKVLEKLRDRQAATYQQEENRREAKQLDETAAIEFGRHREVRT